MPLTYNKPFHLPPMAHVRNILRIEVFTRHAPHSNNCIQSLFSKNQITRLHHITEIHHCTDIIYWFYCCTDSFLTCQSQGIFANIGIKIANTVIVKSQYSCGSKITPSIRLFPGRIHPIMNILHVHHSSCTFALTTFLMVRKLYHILSVIESLKKLFLSWFT